MLQPDGIDLTAPELWMGDPFPTLDWLRSNAPVFRHHVSGLHDFWAVTRYDDIVAVSKRPEIFASGDGVAMTPSADVPQTQNMVEMDDPRHKLMRALVSKGFTPNRIRSHEPRIREIASSILDAVPGDECEFVADVASALPIFVIGEMLGVPQEDHHLIKEWSDAISQIDPEGTAVAARLAAMGEMFGYLGRLQEKRLAVPRDDLVSTILAAEVEGETLSLAEQQAFFMLLQFAGNETTRNAISGAMLALSEHPDQQARLVADPAGMTVAVEEFLRWVSPVIQFRRTVTQDTELRGVELREGDWVVVFYGAGNRDPDVFERAGSFDVARSPNPQIALGGGGPHFCLGAALGRLEIRILFEELLRRYPAIEVAGPVERVRSNFINGISRLPVRLGSR